MTLIDNTVELTLS